MILCCGEALIDMLQRKSDAGEACLRALCRRRCFQYGNCAWTARRCNRILLRDFLGLLRPDAAGQSGCQSCRHRLRAYFATTDHARLCAPDDGQASYMFYDENSAGRSLAIEHLPEIDDNVTALQFGAISLIPEPCGSTYEALMAREHEKRVIILDPEHPSGIHPRQGEAPCPHAPHDRHDRHRQDFRRGHALVRRERYAGRDCPALDRSRAEADGGDARRRRAGRLLEAIPSFNARRKR